MVGGVTQVQEKVFLVSSAILPHLGFGVTLGN